MSKEFRKVEKDELADVLCDMCHRSCKRGPNLEYLEVYTKWGFGSNKDLAKWEAQFCEDCSDKIDEFVKKEGGEIPKDVYYPM